MRVVWLYGLAGAGKTSEVFMNHEFDKIYVKEANDRWWDGYEQHEVILIDDFRKWHDFGNFLRLLDRWPYSGEIKGGTVKINSKFCYITSDRPPENIWSGNDLEQVTRRIDELRLVGDPEIYRNEMAKNGKIYRF